MLLNMNVPRRTCTIDRNDNSIDGVREDDPDSVVVGVPRRCLMQQEEHEPHMTQARCTLSIDLVGSYNVCTGTHD